MRIVNGDEIGLWDGVVRIVWGNKGKTIYHVAMGIEEDTIITLNDCLEAIGYDGEGVVIVIFDELTSGVVYQFGNYGDSNWYEYGETRGYA